MKISDETLLAYVDGELDPAARAEVEAAIAADPEIARRVEQQRSLRRLLGAAYGPVLDEPVPPRLLAAAQPPAKVKAKVVALAAARKARRESEPHAGWGWQHWGGMAACLVLGLFAGRSAWFALPGEDIVAHGGELLARGTLAQALSTQLASAPPADAPVKIGVSYLSRADEYCRSFSRTGMAGLACRRGNDWALRVLAQDTAPAPAGGNLRMAASPVPAVVLKAIDEQIQGSPLDAQAERAAVSKGWRR
ncbi:MAG TPA: hypothetical protein VF169_00870 [Albitalea sp.]|uniref:anti-sigma factor family protein n=1 Tax=Piscinibacter sp. TaxID=1903157 RepID=UPI002ED1CAA3